MIWISDGWKEYEVLDTAAGERLERWGKYTLVRPDPQVIWDTPHTHPGWKNTMPVISVPLPVAVTGLTITCRSDGRFTIRTT